MDDGSVIVQLVSNLQIVAYVKVACLSLLFFDTAITLDQEYRYIWQKKWHVVKILYLLTRYSTFVDTSISVYERLYPSFMDCNHLMTFTTIFAGAGIGLTELILMIRTYALYNLSRRVLFGFITLWLILGGVSTWAIMRWTGTFNSHIQILPPELDSSMKCYLGRAGNLGLVCYLSLLAGETVIVLMTAWKALSSWWYLGSKSTPLITSFYRDGIVFYFCILPFTIVNVISLLQLPEGLLLIADTPLRVIHTILACRLVLHVRRIADPEDESSVEEPAHSLVFVVPSAELSVPEKSRERARLGSEIV